MESEKNNHSLLTSQQQEEMCQWGQWAVEGKFVRPIITFLGRYLLRSQGISLESPEVLEGLGRLAWFYSCLEESPFPDTDVAAEQLGIKPVQARNGEVLTGEKLLEVYTKVLIYEAAYEKGINL